MIANAAPIPLQPGEHTSMEGFPDAGSLLPFNVSELEAIHDRLMQVTVADLQSFIAVRKEGSRSDSMLAALYGARLSDWHLEAGRLSDERMRLLYNVGQLYGMQLFDDRYQTKTGKKLQADDADAYAVARQNVLGTYDLMDMPEGATRWEQEKRRELAFTGSDLLGLLNASLHDRMQGQARELYGDIPLPHDDVDSAFYTGLVDAVIFADTYVRFRGGKTPQRFPVALSYAPIPSETTVLAGAAFAHSDPFAAVEFEIGEGDGLTPMADFMKEYYDGAIVRCVEIDGRFYDVVAVPILTQTGPNTFRQAYDIISVSPVPLGLETSPRKLALRAGVLAMAGAVVANGANILMHVTSGMHADVPQSTVLGVSLGLGVAGIQWARSLMTELDAAAQSQTENHRPA